MIGGVGIGKRHSDATFENFIVIAGKNNKALEASKRVAAGESGGVILLGAVGRGKTHLLVALAKAFDDRVSVRSQTEDSSDDVPLPDIRKLIGDAADLPVDDAPPCLNRLEIAREARIEFWPILDLVSELRAEIKTGELALSSRCRECDLLVLDDLGQERVTDFVLEELERIIDWRYRNVLPIAVSSNLSIAKMRSGGKYGERAISRWAESCEIVEIGGEDMRINKSGALTKRVERIR